MVANQSGNLKFGFNRVYIINNKFGGNNIINTNDVQISGVKRSRNGDDNVDGDFENLNSLKTGNSSNSTFQVKDDFLDYTEIKINLKDVDFSKLTCL